MNYLLLIGIIIFENLLCNIFGNSEYMEIFSVIIIIINIPLFIYLLFSKNKINKTISVSLSISFILRTILVFFDYYAKTIFILPGSGSDTEYFHYLAVNSPLSSLTKYPFSLKMIYMLNNNNRLFAQYLNVILLIFSILIIIKTLKNLKINSTIITIIAIVICFFPSNIITSAILLRESIMLLLTSISIYYFVKWFTNNNIKFFFLAIIFMLFTAYYHSGMLLSVFAMLICLILYSFPKNKFIFNKKTITYLITSIFFGYLIITLTGNNLLSYFNGIQSFEDYSVKMKYVGTNVGSAYLPFLNSINSYKQLILFTPLKFLYFFASPVPWEFRGLQDIITFFLNASYYIYVFILYAINGFKKNNDNLTKMLITIVVFTGIVYSWGTMSAGTAMRHRENFIIYFLIINALILNNIRERKIKEKKNETIN